MSGRDVSKSETYIYIYIATLLSSQEHIATIVSFWKHGRDKILHFEKRRDKIVHFRKISRQDFDIKPTSAQPHAAWALLVCSSPRSLCHKSWLSKPRAQGGLDRGEPRQPASTLEEAHPHLRRQLQANPSIRIDDVNPIWWKIFRPFYFEPLSRSLNMTVSKTDRAVHIL